MLLQEVLIRLRKCKVLLKVLMIIHLGLILHSLLEMYRKELKYWQKLDKVILLLIIILVPLAYLMAKSHGLTEFEKTLEESIN